MTNITLKKLSILGVILFAVACGDRTPNDTGASFSPHTQGNGTGTSSGTPVTPQIYIFSPGIHFGGFGNRTTADGLCKNAIPADLSAGGFETHALLNFGGADTIAALAISQAIPNKPIYAYGSKMLLANNWDDMLSGNLRASLATAGVLAANTIYWTGFNADGTTAQDNCNGFTDSTGAYSGQIGNSDYKDGRWAGFQADACSVKYYYLCVAFKQ